MIINHTWKEACRLWTVGKDQYLESFLPAPLPRLLTPPMYLWASLQPRFWGIVMGKPLCLDMGLFFFFFLNKAQEHFFQSWQASHHGNENLFCFIWECPRNWGIKQIRESFMFASSTVLTNTFILFSWGGSSSCLYKRVNYIHEALSILR